MYADALLMLSGTAIAGSTGYTSQSPLPVAGAPVLSTNTVDLGVARDMGQGRDLYARVQITTAYTLLTSLLIEVIAASDAALTTNIVVIGSSGAIPLASLVINARFAVEINPLLASKGQRYIGMRYSTVGTTPGAGALIADIGPDYQDGQKFYTTGIAVI